MKRESLRQGVPAPCPPSIGLSSGGTRPETRFRGLVVTDVRGNYFEYIRISIYELNLLDSAISYVAKIEKSIITYTTVR